MGRDHYGNTYYQDLAVDHFNNVRYVEYADHFRHLYKTADVIPPAWDGWLKGTYDDVPSVI